MNAVVNTAPGEVEWREYPMPVPGADQVRIRTAACGICATDLVMMNGWERTGFPTIPGHEWSGIVDAVGDGVDDKLVGRHCVAENVFADGSEVGFEHPGGYGQYLITQVGKLHLLPDHFPLHVAAMIEPLAVCVRGMRRLRLEDRRSALILGDGPIGLLMLMLLNRAGVEQVAVVGGWSRRLALATELGAAATLEYHRVADDMENAIARLPGFPYPQVIEATGRGSAMATALRVASSCGKVLILGDYGTERASVRWNHLLHQELELIGSCASAGAWEQAVELAVSGTIPLHRLITRCLPASSFRQAIELAREARDVVKVVMEWPAPETSSGNC